MQLGGRGFFVAKSGRRFLMFQPQHEVLNPQGFANSWWFFEWRSIWSICVGTTWPILLMVEENQLIFGKVALLGGDRRISEAWRVCIHSLACPSRIGLLADSLGIFFNINFLFRPKWGFVKLQAWHSICGALGKLLQPLHFWQWKFTLIPGAYIKKWCFGEGFSGFTDEGFV